jgi:hypothetical protein
MKKVINFLFNIPVISLSLFAVNFTFVAFANASQINSTKINKTLIAQQVSCSVINIQTGQLALRSSPNGKSKAGLNNGNTVALIRNGSAPWVYVRVMDGPNGRVNGSEGWVNSNYLSCGEANIPVMPLKWVTWCDVVNIRSGQLALRNRPNGQPKAGLNNGNHVQLLKQQGIWAYVTVFRGPNSRVQDMKGWVNSNFLSCTKEPID